MVHTVALAMEATLPSAASEVSEVCTALAPQVPLVVLDLALSYLRDYQVEADPVAVAERALVPVDQAPAPAAAVHRVRRKLYIN